ncbi:MAG: potassium transporter TrkG [Myxococcota bacterium]
MPGPKAEIMHARVHQTAVALFRVYAVLTLLQTVAMMICGASLFDALTHSFSTVSTGGFSPYTASAAHFGPLQQTIILVFMVAAGVNFSLYYTLAQRRDASILRDVELRFYLGIVFFASLVVTIDVMAAGELVAAGGPVASVAETALDAAFHVVSLVTTTGFATEDFAQWPGLAHAILVGLMFIGGCAGSTAGGIKVIRVLIGWKVAMREVRLTFSPNSVIAVAIGDQVVPEESIRGVSALILLWSLGWGVGALLLSVGDTDLLSSATASLATLSNIGPGLAAVGPTENFAFFASWQKLVMSMLMWLGRLEFFALLALFQPRFWRV